MKKVQIRVRKHHLGPCRKYQRRISVLLLINCCLFFLGQTNGTVDLSKLLAPAEDYLDGEDEEDDPDARLDPLNSLDLKQYLLTFLRYRYSLFFVSCYCQGFSPE